MWRSSGMVPKVVGLVAMWAVVAAAAVAVGLDRFETSLAEEATVALAGAGVPATLRVEGRDLFVSAPEASRVDAETVLAGVDGVRSVIWVSTDASTGGAVDSVRPAAPTTTQAPQTSTTTEPPGPVARLAAHLDKGFLVVTGSVPNDEAAARLGFIADLIYTPFLDNRLTVDPSLPDTSWSGRIGDVIAVLPIVSTASIEVVGDEAILTATAPSEERAAQLEGALRAALGDDVDMTTDISITGLSAPSIEVTAPGDGSVSLSGTLPSAEMAAVVVRTAEDVFGAENVIDRLIVADDVYETFSLFRLPLTFPAFRPFHQWNVEIVDDRISGNLRGGATFPSGSARLTPELEQLLQIAAGILSRNPTLLLTVEGHTDAIGSDADNLALSQRRADAAVQWLVLAGIDSQRLFAVGYGETRPIGDNATASGRESNRRIEFKLGPPDAQGGTG